MKNEREKISILASWTVVLLGIYLFINSVVASFHPDSFLIAIWMVAFFYFIILALTWFGLVIAENNWYTWIGFVFSTGMIFLVSTINDDWMYPLLSKTVTVILLLIVLLFIPLLLFCIYDLSSIVQNMTLNSIKRTGVNVILTIVCLALSFVLTGGIFASGILSNSGVSIGGIPMFGIMIGFAPLILGVLGCIHIWTR